MPPYFSTNGLFCEINSFMIASRRNVFHSKASQTSGG